MTFGTDIKALSEQMQFKRPALQIACSELIYDYMECRQNKKVRAVGYRKLVTRLLSVSGVVH